MKSRQFLLVLLVLALLAAAAVAAGGQRAASAFRHQIAAGSHAAHVGDGYHDGRHRNLPGT